MSREKKIMDDACLLVNISVFYNSTWKPCDRKSSEKKRENTAQMSVSRKTLTPLLILERPYLFSLEIAVLSWDPVAGPAISGEPLPTQGGGEPQGVVQRDCVCGPGCPSVRAIHWQCHQHFLREEKVFRGGMSSQRWKGFSMKGPELGLCELILPFPQLFAQVFLVLYQKNFYV